MSKKLWGGRFVESTDKLMEAFNASIDVDKRLYESDIKGSQAHLEMMEKQGIISSEDAEILVQGLDTVKTRIDNNEMAFTDALEDIHMHVEENLGDVCGAVAKKLHTGRSRNDQVALDVRIYLREETLNLIRMLKDFQAALVTLADANKKTVMPGYTHMQRAQPVLFAHHMLAYYQMFKRDMERLEDSMTRLDVMPLGSAALAGTGFPIDREYTCQVLGFSRVSENSMDAVSDRDFIMEFISHASICMIHLSRLSEELILWSTSEFAFITISDAFTTGSSIMPQKKNPDACELVRGKTGRVVGNLMAILTVMKSLPMAYNKDMQEDKEPLFDTVDTLKICLDVYTRMFSHIDIHKDRMRAACMTGFLNATDFADYLVNKGVAFRTAHGIAGKAVNFALDQGKELDGLSFEEMRSFSDLIEKDVYDFISLEAMVARRNSYGGTGFDNVAAAVDVAKKELGL
ncbi:argininosuccinate lyase [Desulfobacter curvatus]|uniref:argininosuccinate lyase n=1 Tax=Desulfobacter curvatus TaxID=2290 RepID=UPI00036C42C8|nr:argininosuccinate lyase [Desulfobacter curvatus]